MKKLPHRGKYWQETEKGAEIPIPKRGAFFRDLGKVAESQEPRPEPPTKSKAS